LVRDLALEEVRAEQAIGLKGMPVIATLVVFGVLLAFAWLVLKLFNSLRSMEIKIAFGAVLTRYESPLLFWIGIGLQGLGLSAVFGVIYYILCVLPNQVQVMS